MDGTTGGIIIIAAAQAEIAEVAIEEWKKEQLEAVIKDHSSIIKS